ncbi:hypothetical protein NA56DRAFT_653256 [Hyaloscypha hepaticicola]|uniref:Ubiquitin-like domain-containing protein n=1 Tax=Hyaloscypha hepaticicola TaxID=2082293 RepID=A0A2J6QQP1_9HELO|nr:hypothetical protein NA56DRAFT_653256 [Hyaloscypha hepaticicola]
MVEQNKLSINLGNPPPDLNAHECLYVHQGDEQEALTICFKRTVRIPEDGTTYNLPPGLGNFPLYNVAHYKETLPESMMLKGGCFMPVHDREALWIGFESTRPFAIKILLGGVNAISGEPLIEAFATALGRARLINEGKSIQDYAVVDPANYSQLWLDGIAEQNGRVMQFLGVRAGSGYSVEAQIANADAVGGIQIMVTPLKQASTGIIQLIRPFGSPVFFKIKLCSTVFKLLKAIAKNTGIPVEQLGLLYNNRRMENDCLLYSYVISDGSIVSMVLNLQGGGPVNIPVYNPLDYSEMSVGADGFIKQFILRDPHASTAWDSDNTVMFNIQLLSADVFQHVTGMEPTPSPVTVEVYAASSLPFFEIQDEEKSGVEGLFSDVKSVGQLDWENGFGGLERELAFPAVELDKTGFMAEDMTVG